MNVRRLAFVASPTREAEEARAHFQGVHGTCDPLSADVIVALGGDGFMLHMLHDTMH